MTESEHQQSLIEASFYRAAECLGDVTPKVMERYYRLFPAARERFEAWACGDRPRLEGEMVEQTIYCMLRYHESPSEIDILLFNTVPHHVDTLGVSLRFFTGFLDSVTDVILETIPPDSEDERRAMQELHRKLHETIDTATAWLNPVRVAV